MKLRLTILSRCLFAATMLTALAYARVVAAETPTAPYDHMHLRVPDPGKAAAWYIKYMGGVQGGQPNEVQFGPTVFMFMKGEGAAPSAGSVIDHVGFSFKDLDAKMKELEDSGAKVTMATRDIPGLFKLAFIEDPWGVKIELAQDEETLGFHHIHLRAKDPAAMMKWVSESFGGTSAKLKDRIDGLKFGNLWLLTQPSKEEVAPSAGRAIDHLSWTTTDLKKSSAELKSKGATFSSKPGKEGKFKDVFVTGPEGLKVELLQRKK